MLLVLLSSALLLAPFPQSPAPKPPPAAPAAKAVTPAARAGHALVWDSKAERVLLLNGDHENDKSRAGELLAWDGRAWTVADGNAPPPRTLAAVAYDRKRGRLVVQGGLGVGDLVYGDTLEWDGSKWHTFADDGKGPGVRNHHAAAFDAERGVVVLFGGQDRDIRPLGDTWEWDGKTWQKVATRGPSARVHHDLVFDPVGKRVLMFGGCSTDGGVFGDLSAWNGKSWRQLQGEGMPSPRVAARFVFDAGKQEVVLLGGDLDAPGPFAWNGERWRRDAGDPQPPPRSHHAMAYDEKRSVLVLFGGQANGQNLGDTWERDAAGKWRCASPSAPSGR